MSQPRVTIFYEAGEQPAQEAYNKVYPNEIGPALAAPIERAGIPVAITSYGDEGHTLTPEILAETDVMIFWMHRRFEMDPDLLDAIERRVHEGMGIVILHSAVVSRVFHRLIGSTGSFIFRNAGERERVWVIDRGHPLAQGIGPYIELEGEEMYGEEFDIPTPDELVFISWWEGGEVFRSGCVWKRGRGKVFFFRPGHETAPTFHNPDVQRVLVNAARYLTPMKDAAPVELRKAPPPPEGPNNPGLLKKYEAWKPLPPPQK